jgi:hypothetical protein
MPTVAHRDRTGQRVLCGACGWGPICHVSRQRIPEVVTSDGDRPISVRGLDVGDDPRAAGEHLRFGDLWRRGADGILGLTPSAAKRATRSLPLSGGRTWTPASLPVRAACPKCGAVNTLDPEHLRVAPVRPGQFVAERLRFASPGDGKAQRISASVGQLVARQQPDADRSEHRDGRALTQDAP